MKTHQQNKLTNRLGVMAVCILMSPACAFAALDSTLITQAESDSQKSNFSFDGGLEFSQSVAKTERSKRQESVDMSFAPGYRINDSYKLTLRSFLSKTNSEDQRTQLSDSVLTLSIRGLELSPSLISVHSVSGVIPTSKRSQEQDRLKGAASLSNGVHYLAPFGSVTYRLGYTQFVHDYDFNAEGSANVQHSLSNSLGVQIFITEKIYLSTLGLYRLGQTYGGKSRSSFEIHGDLNWDVRANLTLNLGTSNAGQALRANGVDSNISAYNDNTSVMRLGILMSL